MGEIFFFIVITTQNITILLISSTLNWFSSGQNLETPFQKKMEKRLVSVSQLQFQQNNLESLDSLRKDLRLQCNFLVWDGLRSAIPLCTSQCKSPPLPPTPPNPGLGGYLEFVFSESKKMPSSRGNVLDPMSLPSGSVSSSETQGQLVGTKEFSWAKVYCNRARRPVAVNFRPRKFLRPG